MAEETRVVARVSAAALLSNYDAIQAQVPGLSILPMIKADAYGHGASWVARILARSPGLYGFGVATLEEGLEVRKALDTLKQKARVVVISGATPFTIAQGQFCEKYFLTATITREEDWALFFREGFAQRIPYELKFNTGMNRLGMQPGFAKQIAKTLKDRPRVEHPSGVLSHFAAGENPADKLTQAQLQAFREIRSDLSSALPSTHFHLANSSGIWNAKDLDLKNLTDVVRPGLSLYGVPPWKGAPARGLQPVMTLQAPVIATHRLKAGDRVGYGGTFRVEEPTYIAILAMGYADGLRRNLGGVGKPAGHVLLNGVVQPLIGIVSMDMCAVSSTQKTKVGDWAQILGPGIDPWLQASEAGTVPYEMFTGISARVPRESGNG
jgi:alanine racemase